MKRAIVKRFIVVLIVAMAISSIVISMSYLSSGKSSRHGRYEASTAFVRCHN